MILIPSFKCPFGITYLLAQYVNLYYNCTIRPSTKLIFAIIRINYHILYWKQLHNYLMPILFLPYIIHHSLVTNPFFAFDHYSNSLISYCVSVRFCLSYPVSDGAFPCSITNLVLGFWRIRCRFCSPALQQLW